MLKLSVLCLQHVAQEHGLILVDTKYEFGKGRDGSIVLIDEVLKFFLHIFIAHSLSFSFIVTHIQVN